MKIGVRSKGLGRTLEFFDAGTGEIIELEGIKRVAWEQERGAAVLTVEFYSFELDAEGIKLPSIPKDKES